ncbi:Canalicular multispecific organic anion transporter 2, partial [Entomortierella lignicola]
MSADPSIWNHKLSDHALQRNFNTLTTKAEDPTKVWIAYILECGGFLTLLGIPALLATILFIRRVQWLKANRKPHNYGRTNLIFWPEQTFILSACLVLLSLLRLLLTDSNDSSDGLILGVSLTLIAWATAIVLNQFEFKYETRSSNYLCTYYFTSFSVNSAALYILSVNEYQEEVFNHMLYFNAAIAVALFFETYPRKNTKVQRLAREKENLNEYEQANLFSRISIQFFQKIVSVGATRPLTGDDLTNTTPKEVLTNVNYERIVTYWEQEKSRSIAKNKEPSFLWAVLRTYRIEIYRMITIRLLGYGLLYLQPMLIGQLLQFVDDYSAAHRDGTNPPSTRIGYTISALMLYFNMCSVFAIGISYKMIVETGIKARASTIAMIYRKSLVLSPQAKQSCTLGEITNYMAVDAERWIETSFFLPLIITIPIELVIAIYLLYQLLGWSLFAGLAVFGILVPIQAKTADFMNGFQEEQLKWMDKRLRVMTELLSNIKIIKLYHWETPMRKKIDDLRANELKALKGFATIRSILTIVFSSVTLLMALFTFWAFAYYGGPNMTPGVLTSEIIFVSITLFGIMNRPLGLIAHTISRTIAINVAMRRVQKFMLMEEIDSNVVRRYSRQSKSSINGKDTKKTLAVDIENGTFMWEKSVDTVTTHSNVEVDGERQPLLASAVAQPVKPVLSNIELHIPEGNLTAIVGRVGQGKSSLLSAIMGEMYKNPEGVVTVYGDLAYVPQQAWIINATVRDNITFGKPFNQSKYDLIINASGLKPDLEMLVAGDQTEIGERGINLSGGQKQRVSLARAAYQDADIYLLDDPLSAVDAHVDQHLWQNLIGPDGLLKDKTRLLVTHGIHHLENVDQIVVLKDGTISEQGDYQKLMKARGAFYQLIKEYSVGRKKKSSHSKHHLRDLLHGRKGESETTVSASSSIKDYSDSDGETSERNTIVDEVAVKSGDEVKVVEDDSGELIADEKMEEGRIGWNIVRIYAKAASYHNAVMFIILIIAAQACQVGTNFWLRYWISDTESRKRDGSEPRPISYYLIGYGELVVLYMIMDVIVNYLIEVVCGISASKALYDRLMTRVLRMPMSFFDTTPMGRIVNRFSSDINSIDVHLPEEWNDLITFIAIIGGALFVMTYSTPIFLLAIPPLIATYFWIQYYFIKSSSSLKRLNSVSKSPLYQHFSETLTGVSTIRVMKGLREQFIQENETREDTIINRFYNYCLDNIWLQIRLESLGTFTMFIASALSVWYAAELDPSLVGLALSYALSMVNFVNYLVRTVCEVQNILVSVERVDEYSRKPIEAPIETGARLPPNWPAQGRIVFKNYSARYREGLDLVVNDISFTVEPTESVGIVGRTGAGKSSLTLALFRIIEAAD